MPRLLLDTSDDKNSPSRGAHAKGNSFEVAIVAFEDADAVFGNRVEFAGARLLWLS
jgi:hypothetical protein